MLYVFGDYTLNMPLYKLCRAGVWVRLEPKVFGTLAYLLQHRQRVVLRHELFEHLWPEQYVSDAALERCIAAARRAIGDSRQVQCRIQTVPRRGYRFVAPVEERLCAPPDLWSRPAPPPLGTPQASVRERGTLFQPTNSLEAAFCAVCGAYLEASRVPPTGRPQTPR
jgi:DNA-binding winged helix-turn-helix (wHTH) protein